MDIDLHNYHPTQIVDTDVLYKLVRQGWEMGERELTLIHGHGRNRGISPGFVNTNTPHFGLRIRRALPYDDVFRQWIFSSTLDCRDRGTTSIRLKPNPAPNRKEIDCLPESKWFDDWGRLR
jgi:hypothetical protein